MDSEYCTGDLAAKTTILQKVSHFYFCFDDGKYDEPITYDIAPESPKQMA